MLLPKGKPRAVREEQTTAFQTGVKLTSSGSRQDTFPLEPQCVQDLPLCPFARVQQTCSGVIFKSFHILFENQECMQKLEFQCTMINIASMYTVYVNS
ncbi:hypothetical protein STEG23_010881 [Scotinomys teguina]